jgi:DNA-binding HxlR family transcriptional regulator
VEYRLTPLGESLKEPLDAICRWSEAHALELLRSEAPPASEG